MIKKLTFVINKNIILNRNVFFNSSQTLSVNTICLTIKHLISSRKTTILFNKCSLSTKFSCFSFLSLIYFKFFDGFLFILINNINISQYFILLIELGYYYSLCKFSLKASHTIIFITWMLQTVKNWFFWMFLVLSKLILIKATNPVA